MTNVGEKKKLKHHDIDEFPGHEEDSDEFIIWILLQNAKGRPKSEITWGNYFRECGTSIQ